MLVPSRRTPPIATCSATENPLAASRSSQTQIEDSAARIGEKMRVKGVQAQPQVDSS